MEIGVEAKKKQPGLSSLLDNCFELCSGIDNKLDRLVPYPPPPEASKPNAVEPEPEPLVQRVEVSRMRLERLAQRLAMIDEWARRIRNTLDKAV